MHIFCFTWLTLFFPFLLSFVIFFVTPALLPPEGAPKQLPGDPWTAELLAAKEAEPLSPTVMAAAAPMAVLGLDVELMWRHVRGKRAEMRVTLRANGIADYGEERALAIHVYTVEVPVALYTIINAEMQRRDALGAARRRAGRHLGSRWS